MSKIGDCHVTFHRRPPPGFAVQLSGVMMIVGPFHSPTGVLYGDGNGWVWPGLLYGPSGVYPGGSGNGSDVDTSGYRPPTKFDEPRSSSAWNVTSMRKFAGIGLIGVMPTMSAAP